MAGSVQRSRADWIDVVRGTAVILVILVHALQRTELFTGHEFAGLETLTIVVTPLRLPAMFLLSGLFVTRSLAKGIRPYAAGKLRRIAWPYLLWSVLLIAFFSDAAPGDRNRIRLGGDVAHLLRPDRAPVVPRLPAVVLRGRDAAALGAGAVPAGRCDGAVGGSDRGAVAQVLGERIVLLRRRRARRAPPHARAGRGPLLAERRHARFGDRAVDRPCHALSRPPRGAVEPADRADVRDRRRGGRPARRVERVVGGAALCRCRVDRVLHRALAGGVVRGAVRGGEADGSVDDFRGGTHRGAADPLGAGRPRRALAPGRGAVRVADPALKMPLDALFLQIWSIGRQVEAPASRTFP